MREAEALLLAHSDDGHFTEGSLRRFLRSGPVRTAQMNCVKVGSTLKDAAKHLQATGHLTLEKPTRLAVSPQDAHEVATRKSATKVPRFARRHLTVQRG